jgi:hypothetical protein
MPWLPDDWFMPAAGTRLRQIVAGGAFVVQRRELLGSGSARLTRHTEATATTFTLVRYEERAEIGMSCHVVHLRDDADGDQYVVECGLMGPGLPRDAFEPAPDD